MSMKGKSGGNMSVTDAVEMIHATPPDERSRFVREIWNIRRIYDAATDQPWS